MEKPLKLIGGRRCFSVLFDGLRQRERRLLYIRQPNYTRRFWSDALKSFIGHFDFLKLPKATKSGGLDWG